MQSSIEPIILVINLFGTQIPQNAKVPQIRKENTH